MTEQNILRYFLSKLKKITLFSIVAVISISSTQNIARTPSLPIGLDNIVISPDNSQLTYFRSGFGFNQHNSVKNPLIRRIDIRTGKLVSHSLIKSPLSDFHKSLGFTANSERLLLLKTERATYPDLPRTAIVVYNRAGQQLYALREPRKSYFEDSQFRIQNKGIVLSPNSRHLALLDIETRNTVIHIMDINANKVIQRIPLPKKLHYGTYYGGGLTFNHNGQVLSWLARGLDDGTDKSKVHLYRYNVHLKKFLAPVAIKNDPYMYDPTVRYSPNGRFAVLASEHSSQFHLVDLKNTKDKITSVKGRIGFVGFSVDQKHLVIVDITGNKIVIRDIETGKEISSPFVLKKGEAIYGRKISVVQSQDLKYLAISLKARSQLYRKDKILLFNTQNGQLVRRIEVLLEAKPIVLKPKVVKPKDIQPKEVKPRGGFFSQQVKG